MDKPMSELISTRRSVLATGIAGFVALRAKSSLAQEIRLPRYDETLSLMGGNAGIRLIYVRFSLAFSLTLDLVIRLSGAQHTNPESALNLPVFPAERAGSLELFRIITELAVEEQRTSVLEALRAREDPLSEPRGSALSVLVNQIALNLPEVGISVDSESVFDALGSCGHVERLASVTRDTSSETSYICRQFPFSYFCR